MPMADHRMGLLIWLPERRLMTCAMLPTCMPCAPYTPSARSIRTPRRVELRCERFWLRLPPVPVVPGTKNSHGSKFERPGSGDATDCRDSVLVAGSHLPGLEHER